MKNKLMMVRDSFAFSYAWLVLCVVVYSLIRGNHALPVSFLGKLLLLCLWGGVCFTLCFKSAKMQKKGFLFSLTCFYLLFIPAEILLFYWMGIFRSKGGAVVWILFFAIVFALYLTALFIDGIMKKKALLYSEKLKEYQHRIRD